MPLPVPKPGLVISYAYLWQSEFARGQEEGLKDLPCAVVVTAQDAAGETIVTAVPVTHNQPQSDGVEIPLVVKQRLGLDESRSWAVASEVNRFIWTGPDLRSTAGTDPGRFDYGFLPPSLFRRIRDGLLAAAQAQWLRVIPRSE